MRKRYPESIKAEVLKLGKRGLTYPQIQEQFPIPKSTLSFWFKNAGRVPDRTKQLAHLERARFLSSITKRRQRMERLADAARIATNESLNIDLVNTSQLKALLAMLYWAEGTKSDTSGGPKFVNTDPLLATFYLSMLRSAYEIDESRLRVRLHLHHYHDQAGALAYWSDLLKVPKSQFGKIYVKKRSTQKKFRENFQGICFIGYYDSRIRRELLALGRILAEKQCTLPSFNG